MSNAKTICFSAALLCLITSCLLDRQPTDGFVIRGEIKGMNKGKLFILRNDASTVSVDVKEGKFVYRGKMEQPKIYFFTPDTTGGEGFPVLMENASIRIHATPGKLWTATYKGSDNQAAFTEYTRLQQQQTAKQMTIFAMAEKDSVQQEAAVKAYDNWEKETRQSTENFIRQYPKSIVSLFALEELLPPAAPLKDARTLFNNLDLRIRESEKGKILLANMEQIARTDIGNMAPLFALPDTSGKMVAISSYKGKYLLLDFWASWCGPCREENPNVVKAYQKFKNKGFDILGVSLDEKKDKWMAAIEKDQLPWTHVSDLQGWESNIASQLYVVKAIPSNFLIDPSGKIVARDLRGAELEAELAKRLR